MALTYDQDSRLKDLAPVLDEHAEWFGRVMRQAAYPEADQSRQMLALPESFRKWIAEAQKSEDVSRETIDHLSVLYTDLQNTAMQLLKDALVGTRPDLRQFDALVTMYDEFVSHVRRLERDLTLSDSGYDIITGLRTRQVMARDIERELDRCARRGRAFCLALARVDCHEDIQKNISVDDYNRLLKDSAMLIKKSIRSFDDAYHLGGGEFLMSLKQTELAGGTAGVNRLRKLLEQEAPFYTLRGGERRLSMSACVAEPQPGDNLDELMTHMRADLDRYKGDGEAVVEYIELSPIQRFLIDQTDKPH